MFRLIVGLVIAILGAIISLAKEVQDNHSNDHKSRIPIVAFILVLAGALISFWGSYDEISQSEFKRLRDSTGHAKDSVIYSLRYLNDSTNHKITQDSLGSIKNKLGSVNDSLGIVRWTLKKMGMSYDSLFNESQIARPNISFNFEESYIKDASNKDSLRCQFVFCCSGKGPAINVVPQFFLFRKILGRYLGEPLALMPSTETISTIDPASCIKKPEFWLYAERTGNNDTIIIIAKYIWDNYPKGLEKPKYEYLLWDRKTQKLNLITKNWMKEDIKYYLKSNKYKL